MRRALPVLASLWLGCGLTQLPARSMLSQLPKVDPAKVADHPAIRLSSEVERLMLWRREGSSMDERVHASYAILDESGLDMAAMRVRIQKDQTLREFRGIHRKPDGQVFEYGTDRLLANAPKVSSSGATLYAFRFPNVEPGDTVEGNWVVHSEGHHWSDERDFSTSIPTLHASYRVRTDRGLDIEMRMLNSEGACHATNVAGNQSEFWCEAFDVPAEKNESYRPETGRTNALIGYRLRHYVQSSGDRSDARAGWAEVLHPWAKAVDEKGDLRKDFKVEVDVKDSKGARGRAEKVLAAVSARLWLTSFGELDDARPMQDVWESTSASGNERAVLLLALLEKAGLKVWPAAAVREGGHALDPDYPERGRFNALLLRVDPEDGKPAFWLDPQCSGCKVGQVRPDAVGVEALAFKLHPSGKLAEFEKFKVEAAPLRLPLSTVRTFTARVGAESLTVDLASTVTREASGDWCRVEAEKTEDTLWRETAQEVRAGIPLARLTARRPTRCEPEKGETVYSHTFEVPSAVVAQDSARLVPLRVFDAPSDELFPSPERQHDVVFSADWKWRDDITVLPPPGSCVRGPSVDLTSEEGGLVVSLKVWREGLGLRITRELVTPRAKFTPDRYPALKKTLAVFNQLGRLVAEVVPAAACAGR